MNCSQLIFGANSRGDSKTGGGSGEAVAAVIGGGTAMGGGTDKTGSGVTMGSTGWTGGRCNNFRPGLGRSLSRRYRFTSAF